MKKIFLLLSVFILLWQVGSANKYTRQDSLRGGNGNGRSWWDVIDYYLRINMDTNNHWANSIDIKFKVTDEGHDTMQIDLQEPMTIDNVLIHATHTTATYKPEIIKEKNVYWIIFHNYNFTLGEKYELTVQYNGKPREAMHPPWDGGFINTTDSFGHSWRAVACQGLGASCWWPCKDYQGDEPDSGMTISFVTTSDAYSIISNGKLLKKEKTQNPLPIPENTTQQDGTTTDNADIVFANPVYTTTTWQVKNPINTYNATFYYGNYAGWQDTIMGENGKLDLSFYPLAENMDKARNQFKVAKEMLHCFEYWMGPYPFYEDGYKLVEAPYLGMEHQSAIAYGNLYKMGYLGMDRSGTGIGMGFDYIIIHESGHEWFGNNITARDIADNWLHEGFTTYTETLFAEWILGKEKAAEYCRGEWANIRNDRPIIGQYGVQNEGSADEYDKGAAVLHMIRNTINNDSIFRSLLRALNKEYYHSVVTTNDVESFISRFCGYDFNIFFDQYLRTTKIPRLEYKIKKGKLKYRFSNVMPGFKLNIPISTSKPIATLTITDKWQTIPWIYGYNLNFSKDFLIKIK